MTEESAVKVCVRVRPLIKREESETSEPVQLFWRADKQAIHQIDDDGNQTKSFSFDRVFSADESTSQLYQDIAKPLVVSAVEGYNGTIFAYGQTSSGKTFTMMGSEHNPGVIPLAMADVFKTIKNCPKKEFLLRVSYMEIYNETVTDLLCDSWKRKPLEIREGNYKNVYVADLTEELVTSPEQALSWIVKGEKNRHYGKTKMNQRSSRSHTIFRMILESRERSDPASGENADGAIIVSHLNLVDLAGAERASQTGAEGARFKEGCNINRSLFTLGQVIKKLSDESQKGFLNYRDSKLTRILQNSLGGNAKTVIICTITTATVEETVSTLQFASAAKRMKNDPHVTEVSDERALLRRYRNEIVDLKRRLQEVSSVTKTTVTERESLCQLLQEKDQLQREQEDRIKNLTKLLVTASNVALIPKVPKRRVTWGGKLLRSARLLNEVHGSPGMSFAEPYIKKRRADYTLPEDGEYMDEFDSRFDFTALEEPNMDMEMSSITVRSSSEGSHFMDSPRANELLLKVASLEHQLEVETQSRQRAEERSSELQKKVSELERKQEAQVKPSVEEMKGYYELEKQMVALQHQLQTEVEQRQTAEEKSSSLELKVAELEQPSEALSRSQHTCEQLKRDLEEAIQLCETVGFEKDAIIAERDLIKYTLELLTKDLETLKEEKDSLQKDKDSLQKDMEERRDADEFEKLEQESKKEYERELEAEISRLQKASKQSDDTIQKLEADLAMMSSELKKKTELTTELQSFSDKDLVQEVTQLRRSLDDAECLSLETKKEWAFLRSENISLKERDVTLTADYEKMEDVVKTLQNKLEQEKSRFKKMQTDLQKELMGAFDENTKLTALLDGKVPKHLTDNLVLEKSLSDLRKELDQNREQERSLQSKMEEMETLPVKVDELLQRVGGLTEELCSVKKERDSLISAQSSLTEDNQRLKDAEYQLLKMENDLTDAQLKETELTQQITETREQLQKIQTDLEHITQENSTLMRSLEDTTQKLVHLGEELECVRGERDVLLSEKTDDHQKDSDELQNLHHTISSITEERDQLQEILQTLREERDQLKTDMEENVEMMIESQSELRDAQEKVKELQSKIHNLESQRAQTDGQHDDQRNNEDGQLEKLQYQIKQLEEQLCAVVVEKDHLLFERSEHHEVLERIQTSIMSITEERDLLQERLQQLERESSQLKTHLDEKREMMLQVQSELKSQQQHLNTEQNDSSVESDTQLQQIQTLKEALEILTEEKNQLASNLQETSQQIQQLKEELDEVYEENKQLKSDLQENVEMMIENQEELRGALEKAKDLQNTILELDSKLQNSENTSLQQIHELQNQMKQLREELVSVCSERERFLSERTMSSLDETGMMEKLKANISSLTEERDQLQKILQGLREEREQLRRDQEEKEEMVVQIREELRSSCAEIDHLSSERIREMEEMNFRMSCVTEERDQLLQTLQGLEEEREQLKRDQQLQDETLSQLRGQLQSACVERDHLLSEKSTNDLEDMQTSLASVCEERQQLLERLQTNREEKNLLRKDLEEKEKMMLQLREELELSCAEKEQLLSERNRELQEKSAEMEMAAANITALTEERDQLLEKQQAVREEKDQLKRHQQEKDQMLVQLRQELQTTCAERDRLLAEKETDAACNVSNASSSMTSNDGVDLQEILQGVRELIQVQGELKQKKCLVSGPSSPQEKQKAQLEQIQALSVEMKSLRNESVVLRKDLQEAAETSKTYQELLHITKEELKQQQKENADLMTQSAAKESQLQQQLSKMSVDLSTLKTVRDQHDSEIQNLKSSLTSLNKDKDELQDMLERARKESDVLRRDLHKSEETRNQLTVEYESLGGLTEQLENEKTHTEQITESLRAITEERDQLKQELEGKIKESLTEVNCSVSFGMDQSNVQTKPRSTDIIAEIDASNEKLQAAFTKFQLIIERPYNHLNDVTCDEWTASYHLLPFIPKSQRKVHANFTMNTTVLNDKLHVTAEAYKKFAEHFKSHFEMQVQCDVASFEESRLQDLLILMTQNPLQSLRSLQEDFQQLWDQRLSHLLDRRQHYLQKMASVVKVLEDGLSKHTLTVSEEHEERTRAIQEFSALLRSPDTAAIIQLLERHAFQRMKVTECLNTHVAVLHECHSEMSLLKSASVESELHLKEQRRETLALLQTQNGTLPKTEAELLQDNQRLSLQLQQTHKQMQVIQEQMNDLKAQADASNQKHLLQLQELDVQLKEKHTLIQTLENKLEESESLAKRNLTPGAAELEAMKDKLVKMELDHIAVTTSHEKEISQMSSVLEHRAEVIRKLKETLRKLQQEDEQSFLDSDEANINLGSNIRAFASLKEKKIEELQKKNAQIESLVSKQQEEISKWKRRAYKMKESKKDGLCTPTKRQPILTETEVNSPKKMFLDSPKSKFFDVRSSVPISLNCPTQFFDNSSLGTVPDSSSRAAVGSSKAQVDDWWKIPNTSSSEPTASMNANGCPTQ
ncbi:centromere-associated protein E-like [Myxocyprinus asiaticus]|uniref:centromere-associated protein E-like n=1 Tax=Myxocyprinus asiaticus TaxID=70543 RepID=UPI0022229242|nr:centromere-associated protein E-like [Myxocyprinus asiaticus]